MKYLILDYEISASYTKKRTLLERISGKFRLYKYFQLFEQYKKFRQYKQLVPIRKETNYGDLEFIHITIPMPPGQFNQWPHQFNQFLANTIRKKIQKTITKNETGAEALERKRVRQQEQPFEDVWQSLRLFAVQPELIPYIPPQAELCENTDEVYIILLRGFLGELCGNPDCRNLSKAGSNFSDVHCHKSGIWGSICKRTACLLFLDDGTKDAAYYIQHLSQGWNYVTVCSNRHDELEPLYRKFYEEEGLMIQCTDFEKSRRGDGNTKAMHQQANSGFEQSDQEAKADGCNTVVMDLTGSWKGIHRIYPKNSFVLDITFSREKERYLMAKQVVLSGYVQVARIS